MKMAPRYFSSKVILFGEYTVLMGSQALAVPFNQYKGRLSFTNLTQLDAIGRNSNHIIGKLAEACRSKAFNANFEYDSLIDAVKEGLYFESNIPNGYGLGSSGALVAALYDAYFHRSTLEPTDIKHDLALMESYFHGTSSGTDPLVSLLDSPLHLSKNGIVEVNTPNFGDHQIWLINTGKTANTAPVVEHFKTLTASGKQNNELSTLALLTNQIIDSILANQFSFDDFKTFSTFQMALLTPMFEPKGLVQQIQADIGSEMALKLCGSGGGGFLLGCSSTLNSQLVMKYFSDRNISVLRLY